MFCTEGMPEGFHTKGYIFRSQEIYTMILGSSNITLNALTKNKEWNSRIVSTEQGEYAQDVLNEFDVLWNASNAKDFDEFIALYKEKYALVQKQKQIAAQQTGALSLSQYRLEPNNMQVHFVKNLRALREAGESRALLISATGTGKTYASAFALRDANPKRALFLVHRELIAKQAIQSYQRVFGNQKTFGLLSGNSKDLDSDFIFATMQTMSKDDIMHQFAPDTFDTIIIDEVHRAGASSYKKIMSYFQPNFWLGMSASPERMDGFDIYKLFDHNIAYEIRLQQALEENLLCPFHYFGISDMEVDGLVFDDKTDLQNFNRLVSSQRVEHIVTQLMYYGYCGERPKGLVFCSRKEEANELAHQFVKRGIRAEFLSGDDSPQKREDTIDRLTSDSRDDYLEYIFTVDIFNEGVDIPEINQIVMLRPTESPVIFTQQLGRGLRKARNKDYVVILDFIGNYTNNFMIPIALSGDNSYNKDTIRRYVREGTKVIPGCSTIHFDEISKKRIYASIDALSTTKKLLVDKYLALRHKLGRIPSLCDFLEHSEIDPMLFINYAGSYHAFLQRISSDEKEYHAKITVPESNILDFVSGLLANGKRPHELLILRSLAQKGSCRKDDLVEALHQYHMSFDAATVKSAYHLLLGDFVNTPKEKSKYKEIGLVQYQNGMYLCGKKLASAFKNPEFKKQFDDVVQLGLTRFETIYLDGMDDTGLSLYQKYSRKDVCRLLNWDKDESSTVYGYRIKYGTCPIFVTYEKKDDISDSTKYQDAFVNNGCFSWMTRNRVTLNHDESQAIIHCKENGLRIMLFVKKSDGEVSDFYYMGQVSPEQWTETTIQNKQKTLPIMNFQFKMDKPVREDIYDYITA